MAIPLAVGVASALLDAAGLTGWMQSKLGGVIGEKAAGVVVDVAKVVTGVTDPVAALEAIKADNALQQKLREKLIDNEQEIIRLEFADTMNARAMQQAALAQDDLFSKRFVYYFAAFWSAVSVLYIFLITFADIPADNVRFADTVLGFLLGTVVATIMVYFFGSTRGSSQKTETSNRLIDKLLDQK